MDKLNLDTLFPTNKPTQLNVNSLFAPPHDPLTEKKPSRHIKPFTVDNLIKTQDTIDTRIRQTYHEVYELCLEKIDQANLLRKFDLVFEIPITLYSNPITNFNDCAEYIIRKIRANYMDCCRVAFNRIFITWINIRENKKKALEEKKKKEAKIKKQINGSKPPPYSHK